MCWSKHNPDEEDLTPTTTRKPMNSSLQCPDRSSPCQEGNSSCSHHGLCCRYEDDQNRMICVCESDREGDFCESKKDDHAFSMEMYERAQAIAAFSAVLGVIVITLFVALIILQIKYYRRRKKVHQKAGHHELTVISKIDGGENGKGSKKTLAIQPGYSWRESVRRTHSKAAQKLKNTLSRSVPDDLFQVGLKLAFLGGWKPNHGPIDQQSVAVKAEVKAGATHRCFSAGPVLGDSSFQTTIDVRDPANATDRPSVVHVPAPASVTAADPAAEPAAEDTVK